MTAPLMQSQIVTFRLGDDHFAADVYAVERVLRYVPPRAIPNVPVWIAGVIDYQERVVPIIDLRLRFELPPLAPSPQTRILILNVEDEWVGAVVDTVVEVASIDGSSVQPPPPLFHGLAGEYLKGIVRRREVLVVVLDMTRLLSTSERLVLDHARGGSPNV